MTAQSALDAVLVDIVGPAVVAAGFEGSPNTWRRSTESGDWAVVTVQRSGSAEVARCVIDLAVVPAPWLEFMSEWLGAPPPSVTDSIGLYRRRLGRTDSALDSDQWWQVRNENDAASCAAEMMHCLQDRGLPLLLGLLDRATLLDSLRAGDLGMMRAADFASFYAFGEAVLISDDGPSERLEELLEIAYQEALPDRREAADRYADWVRVRARRAAQPRSS